MMLDLNKLPGEPELLERNANRKFTAREDDGTGLYYYRARYYHPMVGRFVSEDPVGFVDSFNVYRYCSDNPVLLTDPEGLFGYDWAYKWLTSRPGQWWNKNLRWINLTACLGASAKYYHDDLKRASGALDGCLASCTGLKCESNRQSCIANCSRIFELSAAIAATQYSVNSLACMMPTRLPGFPPSAEPIPAPP